MNTIDAVRRALVLDDVSAERDRQEKKFAPPKRSCAHPEMPNDERLRVLVEEIGEVARAIDVMAAGAAFAYADPAVGVWHRESHANALRDELIQVAAVAVAWIEGLGARDGAS